LIRQEQNTTISTNHQDSPVEKATLQKAPSRRIPQMCCISSAGVFFSFFFGQAKKNKQNNAQH
jgi:hypothetical protein